MTDDRDRYDVRIGVDRQLGAALKVAPDESDSGITVVEHTLPPETLGAPLHRHTREDEISYVLEGTLAVQEGEAVSTVEAGEVVVKERGVWHTFWNPGPEPLRFIEMIAPGEFAWYFEEVAEILPKSGGRGEETRERLDEVGEQYDFESNPDSIPSLVAEHGLRRSDSLDA